MKELNSSQQQAVMHESGPLLIVAGAGTGKTTVLTERIKYLIQKEGVNPHHIFATTFTEKASEEMLARLDTVMPLGYQEPWLGTFHSLCDRLLRIEGLEIGLNPNFTLMTQTDQWLFIRQHLFDFDLNYYRPLGNPARFIGALMKFFSRLTDEDVSVEDVNKVALTRLKSAQSEDEHADAARVNELGKAYTKYTELKHEFGKLDFGDLITLTLRLLRSRPNVCKKYQQQFEHVLVDEFQDTNFAQFELIKLLAPPSTTPNLIVVGDDDQAIYKFRGASIANILTFKDTYPQAKEVVLTHNYRSNQAILDSSYQSIVLNNPDRLEARLGIDKKLKAHLPDNTLEPPSIYHFDTLEEEVAWTVKQIFDLVTKHKLTYKDIAIITRANSHLDPYVVALKEAGIPYQLVTNRGLYDQDEIKTILNILQVIADPDDSIALFQLLLTHSFAFQSSELLDLMRLAHQTSTSLWLQLKSSTLENHQEVVKLIELFRAQAADKRITELVYTVIDRIAYLKQFTESESLENQLKIKNLNLFFSQLKRFEAISTDKSVIGFLATFEMWEEAGENPAQAQIDDIDTVSLMTVHKAKGLEFEAVFVAGLVAGRFPSINRSDPIEVPVELIKEELPQGDEHLQEERRLFYVAITRAKEYLYLTFAEDIGGARKRKMSGFCQETGLPLQKVTTSIEPALVSAGRPIKAQYLHEGKFTIERVSYSQIDTFDLCPQKYKFKYLLQIPAPPHHSLSFGRTVHQTLYDFHLHKLQGKPMTLEDLETSYSHNFIEEGYESIEHKQARFNAGLQAMRDYYTVHSDQLGKPIMLEQPFTLKLSNGVVNGKIDRIDQHGSVYEIIDYKTGSLKKQKDIDKDDQLTMYLLAAKSVLNLPVTQASLFFIEQNGQKMTTQRTDDELEKARQKLERKIATMQESDFPAKPDMIRCGFCEYVTLCPFASKKKSA